jgi:hypothetical protein
MKALLIIGLVVAALVGGILVLRGTSKTGMPDEAVLDRAKHRGRALDAEEKRDPDGDH